MRSNTQSTRNPHHIIAPAAILALTAASPALAQTTLFEATTNGDQQVPPNEAPATGTLSGVYDAMANTFSFSWNISDELIGMPSNPGAHIHMAAAGDNGPIVFAFNNPDGTWPLSGNAVWSNLSAMEVDALFNDGLYANFHTTEFPGGEVRGQIGVVPAPGAASIAALGLTAIATRRRRR